MLVNELFYHKKGQVIQNGDFNDIYTIVKSFTYQKIAFMGPLNYTYNAIDDKSIYKQIDLTNVYSCDDKTFLKLTDKPILQIIQLAIPDLFNTTSSKTIYLPIFKNVIIEKQHTKNIAIYFIVLNLVDTKGKNGIIKLFS